MATSNRDVKMTLSVETLGVEEVKKLQDSVQKLADEGGQAAPEFQKLAAEIGRLGEQAAALSAFEKLAADTGDLAQQQQAAAQSAGDLGVRLQEAGRVAAQAADAKQSLVDQLSSLLIQQRANRDELARLTSQTAEAKKADTEYEATTQKLKDNKIALRAEIERVKDALKQASSESTAAAASEKKLADAFSATEAKAKAAEAALRENKAGVDAASQAAKNLGVSTENVAAAQVQLVQSLNAAGDAARRRKESVDETRESDRLLAIESRTLAAELEKGRIALLAENAAQLDVAAQVRATAKAKEQAAAASKAAEDAWQQEAYAIVEAAEAAQKLKLQTEALAEAQRILAAGDAFEKQYQEARKLEEAERYVRELGDALEKLEADQQQAATSAKEAADKISNAFKTVGARSAEELRAEILQVRAAMGTISQVSVTTGQALDGAFAAGQGRIKELEREIREVSGTLTMADKAADLFKNSLGQITAGNVVADGVGYLVEKVKELGREFLGAIVQGDQLRRGLTAIYKDAGVAAAQIDFLRRSSSESGVAFGQLTKEFVKFSASMNSANIPMAQSNALFQALTATSASLGLGTEATAGALNALGQMASKGTVSLEELRQQLGDRIPGALGLAAKGLGITEGQLVKLVESGGLATRDFIGPFTQALNDLKGETDGLVPAFDRLKGLLTEVSQGMGDAGGTTVLTGALKVLGGFLASVALGISAIVEGLFLFGSTLTAVAARIAGDAQAFDFLAAQLENSTKRLTSQANALNAFLDPSAAAAASTRAHAASMSANTAEVLKSINANTQLSAEQKLAALSTALAGDASLNASAKIVQYNVAAAELIKTQQGQTEALGKSAKAAKEQGDTLVALARLTGDSTAIQQASTQAAELYSTALDKVAESQAAETAMLVAQKEELLASAETRKLSAEDIKVETEALDAKITTSKAETEQAVQSALAQKAEVYERQLATQALKNHSGEVEAFRATMEKAAATLKDYDAQAKAGKRTDDEVAQARKDLTTATVLYKDALTDLISKTELESKAKLANLQLASAQAKAGADHSLVLAENARRLGDTATAIYYEIKAREQSIAVLKIEIQIRDLEAKAALATIELKKKSIDATTEEGRKKLEILEIEKKLIEVKLLANGATKDAIDGLQLEIDQLRRGVDIRGKDTAAIRGNTEAKRDNATETRGLGDAIDREYASRLQNAFAIAEETRELKAQAERKRLNMDAEGFSTGKDGNRVVAGGDLTTLTGIQKFLEGAGLTAEQAKSTAREFADSQGNIPYFSNPGQMKYGGRDSTLSQALMKAAERTTFGTGGGTTASAQPIGKTTNVNFVIGGNTQTVPTDEAGAKVLTNVMGQLAAGQSIAIR